VQELRSQLEIERVHREEIARELADLKENEVAIDFTGKAGDLLSWLRKTVGKTLPKQVTLTEIKKILEAEA
jgi:N-acetyl-gamma-glutamylphosphate reductase